MNQTDISKQK